MLRKSAQQNIPEFRHNPGKWKIEENEAFHNDLNTIILLYVLGWLVRFDVVDLERTAAVIELVLFSGLIFYHKNLLTLVLKKATIPGMSAPSLPQPAQYTLRNESPSIWQHRRIYRADISFGSGSSGADVDYSIFNADKYFLSVFN